jgi:hypothetical protein
MFGRVEESVLCHNSNITTLKERTKSIIFHQNESITFKFVIKKFRDTTANFSSDFQNEKVNNNTNINCEIKVCV